MAREADTVRHDGPPPRIVWAIRRAHQAVEAEKSARLQALGLQAAHYALMINIYVAPGLNGAHLARHLGVTPQNVASLSSRLEAAGLIERRAHPRHAHVKEHFLTESGTEIIEDADRVVLQLETELATVLGRDEYCRLGRSLERLRALMPIISTPEAPPQRS